jgi:hypothetical protein
LNCTGVEKWTARNCRGEEERESGLRKHRVGRSKTSPCTDGVLKAAEKNKWEDETQMKSAKRTCCKKGNRKRKLKHEGDSKGQQTYAKK